MRQTGIYIAVLVTAFFFGYRFAASVFGEEIAQLKEEYAVKVVEVQEEYRAKERFALQSMADAWEQRDAAYARLRDRGVELDRLRGEAESARRRLSSVSNVACKSEREQLARSAELLERCGCLLERGVELSARSAIDKDALVKMVQ